MEDNTTVIGGSEGGWYGDQSELDDNTANQSHMDDSTAVLRGRRCFMQRFRLF